MLNKDERSIVIVGGEGLMGKFFASRLMHYGHVVKTLEKYDWDCASDLLCDVDLVLVCVPIKVTQEVVSNIAPMLQETTGLADITSIKNPYLAHMLSTHSGPVLGLHPMFGPKVNTFLSQKVVVCEGRSLHSFSWLLETIKADGGDLIECSADEHDNLMGVIQAVRHFSTIAAGAFLCHEDVNISRTLDFASPIYRMELDMIGRLFAQEPSLYVDIVLANEHRRHLVSQYAKTVSSINKLVQRQDRDKLIKLFEEVGSYLGNESTRALEESTILVEALSIFLSNNRKTQS